MSLINPTSNTSADQEFQAYLDVKEAELHRRLMPILTAAVRLQVGTGSQRARAYVEERATPVLYRHIVKLFEDAWDDVTDAIDRVERKARPFGVLTYKADPAPWKPTFTDFMSEQLGYIASYAAQRIKEISGTLTDYIRQLVFDKVKEGLPNTDIAREIRNRAPEIGKVRAATIARTETHGAALDAIERSLKKKRIRVRKKTWWTAQDARVRATHVAVHGVTIPMDEKFSVGDSMMSRPGDPEGSAEEVINCRCSILYVTDYAEAPSESSTLPGTLQRLDKQELVKAVTSLYENYSFIDTAPEDQRRALHYYLRNNFSKFMEAIRNGTATSTDKARVESLLKLIRTRKLVELPYVYRGLKSKDVNLLGTDPFQSATVSFEQAVRWSGAEGVVLEIERPKSGFTALFAERYWNSAKAKAARKKNPLTGELEVLLEGSRYEKIGESQRDGIRVITVKPIPVDSQNWGPA